MGRMNNNKNTMNETVAEYMLTTVEQMQERLAEVKAFQALIVDNPQNIRKVEIIYLDAVSAIIMVNGKTLFRLNNKVEGMGCIQYWNDSETAKADLYDRLILATIREAGDLRMAIKG